jgi:predicted RND superfamily exporter protein
MLGDSARLWKPILYSMSVVCAGFGIFILSGFPPTQRFGLFSRFGHAAVAALRAFPLALVCRPPDA